uniref:Uncharacterized protein n=1 Tax=Trichogramma kaykai TaxID=54128 RepID=A0ABD2W7J4_9HYME
MIPRHIHRRKRDFASAVSFTKIKKTISRARTPNGLKSNVKKYYSSIRAFYEHIQKFLEMLTMKEGSPVHKISASLISSSSQGDHLILYDKDLLAEFDNRNDMFADATFKVSPNIKGVNQLLTVMCKKLNVAIVRKAKSKDYRLYSRNNATENPKGQEVIKKLLVLPLLPADKIPEGFQIIKEVIANEFADNPKFLKRWTKFIDNYFTKEWMNKIKPETFSVYNSVDRTNNCLESYHRSLNQKLKSNPSVYTFLYHIIKIKENAKLDLERARNHMKSTDAPKVTTRVRDEAIKAAWFALNGPAKWTVKMFINDLSGYNNTPTFQIIEQTINTGTAKKSDIDDINDTDDIDDTDDEDSVDLDDFNYLSESENDELKLVESTVEPVQEPIEPSLHETMKPVAKSPQEVLEPVEPSPRKLIQKPKKIDTMYRSPLPCIKLRTIFGYRLIVLNP